MHTRFLLPLALLVATLWANVAAAENIAQGVRVVVIDAGHGGKFPGASYGGVSEKNLVLKIGLKLGRLIEEQMPEVKVVYTRKTDKTLNEVLADDLQARADIANQARGEMFISIHANAARSAAARGVEVLVMGESPKEQRYNEDALFESNREDLIDMSDERQAAIVRAFIQNRQFTYGEHSLAMARCIHNNCLRDGRHSRGVRPQLLRVLYATNMPGVLVEIGFMSNPQEMAYMKSEKGQNEIAQSLFRSVKEYSAYVQKMRAPESGGVAVKPESTPREETVVEAKTPEQTPIATTASTPESPSPKPVEAEKPAETAKSAPTQKTPLPQADAAAPNTSAAAASKGEVDSPKGDAAPPQEPTSKADASPAVVHYAIQLMASQKPIPLSSPHFKSYKGKAKQYSAEGTFPYKYCLGVYADRDAAQQNLAAVRKVFPGAFVVKCEGARIVK